ncbi:hypothetical protein KIL84_013739 [Mauremys mutica]|uniref:THAP-type domain-containing protein n=1 Tax=Mauremys mutica TaxID=74926 RepID=A0A9D3WRV6_9SAUR|nr:hypothetical protein KIL84_013739 [Mauremys mutica]
MVKYCAAYNCSNADTKLNRKQGITFHRFPKDNKKKQQWAQAVHRADPRIDNSLRRSAKNSKCAGTFLENPPLMADPTEVYVTKTANNPKRLTENFSCAHEVVTSGVCNTQDTVMTDHHYHITDSPKTLKRKLDELLAENHKLRRKLRNASDQEERFHKNMEILLDKLHSKDMLSWEIT